MPMGLVTDEEFEDELNRLRGGKEKDREKESKESHTEKESHQGRDDSPNTPESLRKIIGEESVINGRQAALGLAKDFGISASSVSAYARGATSTASYNSPVKDIIQHINKSRQRAVKKASKTLHSALESITQEKLDYADAKDLSGIAKDMSVIIKNLEPEKAAASETSTPQFVIFAPQFRTEESFDVIDIKE